MKPAAALSVFLLWIAAWPMPGFESTRGRADAAQANGLSRCTSADGVTMFTDKRCSDLQAAEHPRQPPPPERPGVLVRVRSCARNQDDFLFGVRMALENRDVNRLADYYHWTGMDTGAGYRLMDRLHAFSELPLVDVQLVLSMPLDSDATPVPASNQPSADLLRVDQMVSSTDLATRATYFHLRNAAGCWWMQF
jgi:hypothetical protein